MKAHKSSVQARGVIVNCWEYKGCGRETGGINAFQFGVCSAARQTETHGLNHGHNGGRICWAVTGTLCGGKVQGTHAEKRASCLSCDFFKTVQKEEGTNDFLLLAPGQAYHRR